MTTKKRGPGRPKGKKRIAREAARAKRKVEWKKQDVEREKRSRTKSGKLRAAYAPKKRLPKARPGLFEELKHGNATGSVEKRVFRFKGIEGFDLAVDVLVELRDDRPRWATYAMIGDGYGGKSIWVSSRVSSPEETSAWLQGVGVTYTKKGGPFGGKKKSQLWVEVVAMRKTKGARRVEAVLERGREATRRKSGRFGKRKK